MIICEFSFHPACYSVDHALVSLSDDSWHLFMKRFAASVQHITGQELEVKAASDTNSMTIVEQQLEELRSQVEELSDEVGIALNITICILNLCIQRTELRNELNQQIAEINTLKSLPLSLPVPNNKGAGKGGEVCRPTSV